MTNRPLRFSLLFLVLFAQVLPSSAKDKRRPDASTDAVRMIGTPLPSSPSAVPFLQQPGETGSPQSATSLDAFHRNTLPVNIADRYVYMVTKKVGVVFAIGEAGLIARANDANLLSWTMVNSGIGTDEDVYAIEGSGSGILLAGTSAGKIYRSTNTGVSWSLVYWNPAEFDFINYIKTTDNGAGFIAVGDAAVSGGPMGFLSSTNSGSSWTNLNTNITGATHPNGVRFNGATGFLNGTATQGGRTYRGIFRTTNLGSSWQFYTVGNSTADSSIGVAAIDFSAAIGRGLAVKFDSTLWKTTNNGVSWKKIASLPRMGYSIAFVPGTNLAYVVGRNGMISNIDTQNDIVQSVLTDEQQVFTQVQFASFSEGYLNDDLARRRYYSTINATASTLLAPPLGTPVVSSSNSVDLIWNRVTGAAEYDVEIGGYTGATFRATVRSTSLNTMTVTGLAPSTTYYWRVRARNLLTTGAWQTYGIFSTNATTTLSNVRVSAFPSNPSSSTDYRLVYVPSGVGIPLSSILSGGTPNDYRAFRDNAGTPPSHLDELNPSSTIDYHEGFWLIKKGDFVLNTSLDHPVQNSGSVMLNMKIGWNIIGNPYSVPVKWSDVLTANGLNPGLFGSVLYGYFGPSGFAPVDQMEPYTGYYVYSSNASLTIPYPFTATPEVSAPEPSLVFGITYRSAVNEDRMLTLGTDPSAVNTLDGFDRRKPPVFGDQGAVWFERPDWDASHTRFAGDIRPALGNGQTWNFTVQHPVDAPATLTLERRENIPSGYEAVFINTANGMILPADDNGQVQLASKETSGAYAVVIGTREYILNNVPAAAPQHFSLDQNYPNPFNPSTAIRFSVPQDAMVSLSVYDLLGRTVATLIDRPLMSGTYEQTFHAGALASGTYLYALRITSPENGAVLHSSVKKMLLLK